MQGFGVSDATASDHPGGDVIIREAAPADFAALARIYSHYVTTTTVTFEETPVTPAGMAERWREQSAAELPFLVAESGGEVLGFAYASKWKGRCAYRFTVEISVYLDPAQTGRGVGSTLYGRLLPLLESRGVHAVIGGIALPNEASIALHEKFGLTRVAHFREVGFKFGRWIDVGYWQRVFE
jgi:phosphinothricin acetyltransferase